MSATGNVSHGGFSGRKLLTRTLRIAISVALLWLLVRHVGFGDTIGALSAFDASFVLLALALLVCEVLIRVCNWRQLCVSTRCPMSIADAMYAYLSGSFLGAFLPSTMGTDAVRSAIAASRTGSRMEVLLAATISLNLISLAVVSLLGLSAAAYALFQVPSPDPVILLSASVSVICLMGVIFLAVLARRKGDAVHESRAQRFSSRWLEKLMEAARRFVRALLNVDSVSTLLSVLAVAAASYAFRLAVIYVLLWSAGVRIGLLDLLIAGPLLLLGGALPISIGGFGGQQAIAVYVLGSFGIPVAPALATSLAYAALYMVFNAVGAVVYALGRGNAGAERYARFM